MVIFDGLVPPLFSVLGVLLLRKWPLRGEQCDVSQAFSVNKNIVIVSQDLSSFVVYVPFRWRAALTGGFFIRKRAGIPRWQIKVVCKNKVAVWWSSFVAGSLSSKRDHDYSVRTLFPREIRQYRRVFKFRD